MIRMIVASYVIRFQVASVPLVEHSSTRARRNCLGCAKTRMHETGRAMDADELAIKNLVNLSWVIGALLIGYLFDIVVGTKFY